MSPKTLKSCLLVLCIVLSLTSRSALAQDAVDTSGQSTPGVDLADPNVDEGDKVAQQRTDNLIARLSAESIEASFENADSGDDYYYPGFYYGSDDSPFGVRWIVFSNRRFAKLYSYLKALSADEQYAYLSRYFTFYQAQYSATISKFAVSNAANLTLQDRQSLIRITEVDNEPPSAIGTRHALQAIALLSGMVGNARMWPLLKEAFRFPPFTVNLNEAEYDSRFVDCFRRWRVFPDGIQTDVIVLMAQYCDDASAAAAGFDRKAVLDVLPEWTLKEFELLDFRSRVTPFDMHHEMGGWPLDRTKGSYKFDMIYTLKGDKGLLSKIIRAAGVEAAPSVDLADPNVGEGDKVTQQRTDDLIARLSAESIEASFENADRGDDYCYPGFYFGSDDSPFDVRWIVFSNRRFAKLYSDLKALGGDEQHACLSRYFTFYQAQYSATISKFAVSNAANRTQQDSASLFRITEADNKPPSAIGTRHALQSIALLSGMLGNARMWPLLKGAFRFPAFTVNLNEAEYESWFVECLRERQVFPEGFQTDVIVLMAQHCDDGSAAAAGFDRKAVLDALPEGTLKEFELLDFRSRVTPFDVHRDSGGWPLDRTKGSYKFNMIYTLKRDKGLLSTIIRAATGAPNAPTQ